MKLLIATLVLAIALLSITIVITQPEAIKGNAATVATDLQPAPALITEGSSIKPDATEPAEATQTVAAREPADEAFVDNPDYPTIDTRLAEMQARRDGKAFSEAAVLEAMQSPSAWTTVDEPWAQLPLTEDERHDGREFIAFNPVKLESLMPGDTMEIPLVQQGEVYTLQVDYVEVHEDGNVSWHGHLQDFEEDAMVSFTRGDSLTIAAISTPENHFVLQAHGDQGWIATDRTMAKYHPDDEHQM